MNNHPIGIFDSGVGGLSIWKELVKKLSNENVTYISDSANCPYGPKTENEIISLSIKNTEFLIKKGCKIIIVACNTATAAAIDYLRANYAIPFIGMEPAIKPASLNSKTNSIGVLATEGTFNGRLFLETSQRFASEVKLNIKVGDKLVEIVENGLIFKESSKLYLNDLLKPMLEQNIDHLVLGCTHYPFLIPVLKDILPQNVKIVDSTPAVVNQVERILEDNNLRNGDNKTPDYKFYTSGKIDFFNKFMSDFLKKTFIAESL